MIMNNIVKSNAFINDYVCLHKGVLLLVGVIRKDKVLKSFLKIVVCKMSLYIDVAENRLYFLMFM